MSRFVLSALNARYIHSNLAIRCLKAMTPELDVTLVEAAIQDTPRAVAARILELEPDCVGLSVSIWNRTQSLDVAQIVKAARPQCRVVLGGPEVSYDAETLLTSQPDLDGILWGEGERSFAALARALEAGGDPAGLPGLTWRTAGGLVTGPIPPPLDLADLPFPYAGEDLSPFQHRILYYETSRGCPGRCAYCLSADVPGVRFRPLAMVKRELSHFLRAEVQQVKFVDRTFNCDGQRAVAILRHILAEVKQHPERRAPNFHLEVEADDLPPDMVALLCQAPPGLFQLEAGVQSLHPPTLRAIDREDNWPQLAANCRAILEAGRTHLHLDLIAGLPHEGLDAFARSFDGVYTLHPHSLQLGFLKLLRGSRLRAQAEDLGLRYQAQPPYEVLSTLELSFSDLCLLHDVEDLLSLYANSGLFSHSLPLLVDACPHGAFACYVAFARWWKSAGYGGGGHKLADRYTRLWTWGSAQPWVQADVLRSALRLDWAMVEPPVRWPEGLSPRDLAAEKADTRSLVQDEDGLRALDPALAALPLSERRRAFYALHLDPPLPVMGQPAVRLLIVHRPSPDRLGRAQIYPLPQHKAP